jgi:serine/threonine-protein kinase HipA
MSQKVLVHMDLDGRPCLVGTLWAHDGRNHESASFQYDNQWLETAGRFALEPLLPMQSGVFHTEPGRSLFGALGDSAPDRWGRVLMRRAEKRNAQKERRTPRTLREIDYLLLVDDQARQGALRFSQTEDGPYLNSDPKTKIPPLIDLPRLLQAATRAADDNESNEDLQLLLAPGSSLGGARPKASIRDREGLLCIAKFPNKQDELDAVRLEALALTLAAKCGIDTPKWTLETAARRPVLLTRRFDRQTNKGKITRIPYLSAMSMLSARDNEPRSYLEIADTIRRFGAQPKRDLEQLWRRIAFSVLISNTDDHLRNHGFLWHSSLGWSLSPAFDLNPVPVEIKPRILSTSIDLDDPTASIETAFEVAGHFSLTLKAAKSIAQQVAKTTARWSKQAATLGVPARHIAAVASAFEHRDAQIALKNSIALSASNS